MAPRVTVQQAVEMLKVHQLRRENAAIYQQIQDLRDEVLDLKTEQDGFRGRAQMMNISIKDCKKLVSGHHNRLEAVDDQIGSLLLSRDEMKSCTNFLQHDCRIHFCEIERRFNQVERDIDESNNVVKAVEENNRIVHSELFDTLRGFRGELAEKAEIADLQSIQSRLSANGHRVNSKSSQWSSTNVILVHHSIEEESPAMNSIHARPGKIPVSRISDRDPQVLLPIVSSFQLAKNACETQDHHLHDCDRISDTASADHRDTDTRIVPTIAAQESTTTEDIDLDENADIGNIVHASRWTSPESLLQIIPQPPAQSSIPPDTTSLLRQAETECVISYLGRGKTCWSEASLVPEELFVRRLVDGLFDERLKAFSIDMLTATSWSLLNVHKLWSIHALNTTDVGSINGQVRDITPPEPIIAGSNLHEKAESRRSCPSAKATGKAKSHEQLAEIAKPRRSQRIAERSQATAAGAIQDAAQSNIRIAKPNKGVKLKRQSKTQQIVNTFGESENSHIEQSASLVQSVVERTAREQIEEANGKLGQPNDRSNHGDLVGKTSTCRRPDSQTLPRRTCPQSTHSTSVRLPNQKTQEESHDTLYRTPAQTDQAGMQQFPVQKLRSDQRNPSPYNPEPRLVVRTKNVDLSKNLSSADDNDLPPQVMRTHDRRPMPVNDRMTEVVVKGKYQPQSKKRKRAPLPPPPEIPILSTSTEDE